MEAVAIKTAKRKYRQHIDIATWKQSCYDAMNDDFNSPILIAQLFEVRFINLLHDGKETLNAVDLDIFSNAMNAFIFDVLGLEAERQQTTATINWKP
jgi:cysteinyl-tRNA synthetase